MHECYSFHVFPLSAMHNNEKIVVMEIGVTIITNDAKNCHRIQYMIYGSSEHPAAEIGTLKHYLDTEIVYVMSHMISLCHSEINPVYPVCTDLLQRNSTLLELK
jgi:hypothetical protein